MINKRIRIEKVGENPSGIPANPKDAHIDGQFQNKHFSLPLDYWIEGRLVEEIQVGKPVMVMRDIRNGISSKGYFTTSLVQELTDKQFTTKNSVYKYQYV